MALFLSPSSSLLLVNANNAPSTQSSLSFVFHMGYVMLELSTGLWWGSLREGDHWGVPDVDGRIILRRIFRKWEGVVGTGWSGIRIGTGGGHL
jgi:hypothetical protein